MKLGDVELGQAASFARDWLLPRSAIAQWTHFVTSTCNAKCRHCFYPINQRKHELSLEEIVRFLPSLPPIRLLLFSGGEPFLRKDLPEIVNAYHKHCGFYTASIPTNGYSAARIVPMVERIFELTPEAQLGVTISIDGMADFHDQVRGVPGLWDNAVKTLRAIRDLTERYPRLTVGVNTVFMRGNHDDAKQLAKYVFEQIRPTFHTLIFIRGTPVDGTLTSAVDVDRYVDLSRWLDDHYSAISDWQAGSRGVRARLRHEINRRRYEYIARQARGGPFEGFCLAGEREYVLSETGDVFGCELISHRLGNIRDASFEFGRIAAGAEAQSFVNAKRERHCACTHECNTRTMLLYDRRKIIPIVSAALSHHVRPRAD